MTSSTGVPTSWSSSLLAGHREIDNPSIPWGQFKFLVVSTHLLSTECFVIPKALFRFIRHNRVFTHPLNHFPGKSGNKGLFWSLQFSHHRTPVPFLGMLSQVFTRTLKLQPLHILGALQPAWKMCCSSTLRSGWSTSQEGVLPQRGLLLDPGKLRAALHVQLDRSLHSSLSGHWAFTDNRSLHLLAPWGLIGLSSSISS